MYEYQNVLKNKKLLNTVVQKLRFIYGLTSLPIICIIQYIGIHKLKV